jgi:hypothetical protein
MFRIKSFFGGNSSLIRVTAFPCGASRSHSLDTWHSVVLPWMSDRPDAETSTWQHTTFTREELSCPQQDPNPLSRKQLALGRPRTSDFNRCDSRGSDLRRWRFFMRGRALERAVSSHKHWFGYVMDWKDMALVCALLLWTRNVKKRKKFWVHPITSQRLLEGKFYYLQAHSQFF